MRKTQRGQTIPYVAVMIVVLAGAALVVFDMGRMVNARIQSQNAVDAATLAAVSVKITKHHVDTLVRAGMSQQSVIAQAEIRAAQAVALQAFLEGSAVPAPTDPSIPVDLNPIKDTFKTLGEKYRSHANLAYKHTVKLHRQRLMLDSYYEWLQDHADEAVAEAARLAYAVHMQSYDTKSDENLEKNLKKVLANIEDLYENKGEFGEVGGFPYANESATIHGMFGKSFIEIKTQAVASEAGSSLLKYLKQFELTSSSAAQLYRRIDQTPVGPLSHLEFNWYSPRLMAIQSEPDKVAH